MARSFDDYSPVVTSTDLSMSLRSTSHLDSSRTRRYGRQIGSSIWSRTPRPLADKCRRKFLRFFPKGFNDTTYIAWEREYKEHAHRRWAEVLHRRRYTERLVD